MVPGGWQGASSDSALHTSQQSLLGHTAENTLQTCLCAFVEVIWDPADPAVLVSSGRVPASSGYIRLHAAPLEAFAL